MRLKHWFEYYQLYNWVLAILIQVTPLQSVRIFGIWDQPRRYVTWEDLKSLQVSWRTLRLQYDFSADDLHQIQPDKHEWVKRGQLTLHDLPDMTVFPINPYTDMAADLAEVWSMRWSVDTLRAMNVTFDQMQSYGLNPAIMQKMNKSLSHWQALQFGKQHAEKWEDSDIDLVFGLNKSELLTILHKA